MLNKFVLIFLFFISNNIAFLLQDKGGANSNPQATQCGDGLISDDDTLTYPKLGESILPGQVCAWTIHLETLNEFRFNFTKLNVHSPSADCSAGGVRIYSLSNLNPSNEEPQSYTFCDEIPPTTDFFLGGNLVTIVFYTTENNTNSGSGFTLTWRGITVDRERTKHLSTFGTTSSSVIQYPVGVGYEPNLVATWLIKADVPSNKVDFILKSILLEACSIPQICSCDALILYEISSLGKISETRRFCGDNYNEIFSGISSNFILAFFTDFESEVDIVGGFDIVYTESRLATSPTTTLPTSTLPTITTTTDNLSSTSTPSNDTKCGAIIVGENGIIQYKLGVNYNQFERCVFTIRTPESTQITFKLVEGTLAYQDNIHILALSKGIINDTTHENGILHTEGDSVTLNGGVAVVIFSSYFLIVRTGFLIEFEGNKVGNNGISSKSQDHILTLDMDYSDDRDEFWRYPSRETGVYMSNELSTFVFAQPKFQTSFLVSLYPIFHQANYGFGGVVCDDYLLFFKFNSFDLETPFLRYASMCSDNHYYNLVKNEDIVIAVFQSDLNIGGDGFEVTWFYDVECDKPECSTF